MNMLAIKASHTLSEEVKKYLDDALVETTNQGSLYVFESNFTPMWARDGLGPNCVNDLIEEIAIHSYLGSLPVNDFFMKRAGEECGTRGEWVDHPFASNVQVESISRAYDNQLEAV